MIDDLEYIEPEGDPIHRMQDHVRIQKALKLAAQDARRLHKLMGSPMVVWQDGKAVWVPPEEIQIEVDTPESHGSQAAD